jgi:hypothetical protein
MSDDQTNPCERPLVPSEDGVRKQILSILMAWGLPEEPAAVVADVMTDTDLAGVDSHGIAMLPAYERLLDAGELNVTAVPEIVNDGASYATLDAQAGLGHIAAVRAVDLAASKARETGVGVVAVRNSHHYGAVGHYVARAAERGLVCLASTTTRIVSVLPPEPGGRWCSTCRPQPWPATRSARSHCGTGRYRRAGCSTRPGNRSSTRKPRAHRSPPRTPGGSPRWAEWRARAATRGTAWASWSRSSRPRSAALRSRH